MSKLEKAMKAAGVVIFVLLFCFCTSARAYMTDLERTKMLAEQGDASAQDNLGARYYIGYGVPQNYAEAFKWWKKAAEQGIAIAQFMLGSLYFQGRGIPRNYAMAFKWYKEAAEQGSAKAQHKLSLMYADGQGVPQNYIKAYTYISLAVAAGEEKSKEAMSDLSKKMSPEQIAQAKQEADLLSKEIKKKVKGE